MFESFLKLWSSLQCKYTNAGDNSFFRTIIIVRKNGLVSVLFQSLHFLLDNIKKVKNYIFYLTKTLRYLF